jgi:transcriptional regulator with XRE-family HTH domain
MRRRAQRWKFAAACAIGDRFGEMLRASRQDAGLTQRELARSAGIGVGTVRDLEQGRTRTPHPDSVIALSRVLPIEATQPGHLAE